jgi:hypothetical protein
METNLHFAESKLQGRRLHLQNAEMRQARWDRGVPLEWALNTRHQPKILHIAEDPHPKRPGRSLIRFIESSARLASPSSCLQRSSSAYISRAMTVQPSSAMEQNVHSLERLYTAWPKIGSPCMMRSVSSTMSRTSPWLK